MDQVVQARADTRYHEVLLEGLEPDTRYYYEVSGLDDETFYFKTAPVESEARPVRVWILGDSGSGDERAEKVRDAYHQFNQGPGADLILLLGDAAYDAGSDADYRKTSTSDGVIYVVAGSNGKAHKYPLNHPANYVSMADLWYWILTAMN